MVCLYHYDTFILSSDLTSCFLNTCEYFEYRGTLILNFFGSLNNEMLRYIYIHINTHIYICRTDLLILINESCLLFLCTKRDSSIRILHFIVCSKINYTNLMKHSWNKLMCDSNSKIEKLVQLCLITKKGSGLKVM